MKVIIDDDVYIVKWSHIQEDTLKSTWCIIQDKNKKVLAEAYATCSFNDHFCKDTGRKISLKRAVMKLFPNTGLKKIGSSKIITEDYRTKIDRNRRKLFYEAYRTMTKRNRWNVVERISEPAF